MLEARDEADLRWYFAAGQGCTHSPVLGTTRMVLNEDENTLRAARISRTLFHVHHQRAFYSPVLQAYYGTMGTLYADAPHGRLFSVYPFTSLARRRYRLASTKETFVSPYEAMEREFEGPSAGLPELRRLIRTTIEAQAKRLHRDATLLYRVTRKRLCNVLFE